MKKILIVVCALCVTAVAWGYDTPSDLVGNILTASLTTISNQLQTVAIRLLFAFLVLQWVIDGYAMLGTDTDVSALVAKTAKAVLWAMFCLWLLADAGTGDKLSNLGYFMSSSVGYFLKKAGEWAGINGGSFDSADILEIGLAAYGKITWAVVKSTATNAVNLAAAVAVPGLTFMTALMVFATSMIILACCAYIALKVFLVKVQIAIFICVSPLAVAMLGLKGLREQGFAPFKAVLGLIYRIVVLAALVSTLKDVADNFASIIDTQGVGIAKDIWTPILGGMFGFLLLAYLVHKADELASSLASGSITMGTGDLASSVATGVAAGMAGGAAMAAMQAATGGKSMVDTVKALAMPEMGMSNASAGAGRGGLDSNAPKPDDILQSLRGGDSQPTTPTTPKQKEQRSTMGANAGGAVTKAGGSPQMAQAATNAATAGKGGDGIRSAVLKAGGTPQQARAAAVAAELGSMGAGPNTIQAGAAAAAAGGTPEEVHSAVTEAASTEPSNGSTGWEMANVASTAVRPWAGEFPPPAASAPRDADRDAAREARRAAKGSGEAAGIGGKAPGFQDALRTLGQRTSGLNDHLAQDKASMHIQIDHHHRD